MLPNRTSLSTTRLEQSLNHLDRIRRILRRVSLSLDKTEVPPPGHCLSLQLWPAVTKLDYKENPQVVAEALTTTDHDCNLVVSQVINTLELEETLGQRGKNKHL